MRITIVGAGGVGAYYGGVLARAGHQVEMLARGANLETIRDRGLEVITPDERFTVHPNASDDVRSLGRTDAVIVSVKSYSLGEVAPAVAALAAAGAMVVPLLNGVEAADRLRELGVPGEAIVGGVTAISAARISPGVVQRLSPFQRVIIGELAGGRSDRVERLVRAFADAGVTAEHSEEIALELWRKLIFLASSAAACGMSRTSIGRIREAPFGNVLLERAIREAGAVARARRVNITTADEDKAIAFAAGLPPAMRPSLLLDLESGRRTELDILSGAISRYGRELGVSTPVHDTATATIAAASATA
ncbi:MAG TPA: 2-dehydropantoate 2-reductase [Gemmatimonadaceae bacterium]|nr:2-dehydropantoate 2-reductase [Gemmatimonadaceae bacterium]